MARETSSDDLIASIEKALTDESVTQAEEAARAVRAKDAHMTKPRLLAAFPGEEIK